MHVSSLLRPRPSWLLLGVLLGFAPAGCAPPAVDYVGKTCDVQDDCPSDLVCDPATKTCQKPANALDGGAGLDAGAIGPDAGTNPDAGSSSDGGSGPDAGSLGDGGVRLRETVTTVTAGGGALSSTNYRLQVYAAPTTPVGSMSSTNYRLQLGPAPAGR